MRKNCAARLWLRWSRFCVCRAAGLVASTRAPPVPRLHRRLPRPEIKAPGCSRTDLKTWAGLTSKAKAGRSKAGRRQGRCSGRRLSIQGLAAHLAAIPILAILILAILILAIPVTAPRLTHHPLGQVISVLAPRLQATLATGLISTAASRFRIRSGRCAATPISIGYPLPTSSGCCSNCIQ
jgi:hypothetical protein